MRMDRVFALLTALVLCLGALPWAQADTEYPPFQGIVADMAGVLSEETAADLKTLSDRLEDVTGGQIYVLTRHFLGGANAQEYARKVFEVWGLGDQDALLLMVIGEENYALHVGSLVNSWLSAEVRNNLLANSFRTSFITDRNYDKAAADFSVALGQALAKATGGTLDVSGLFGRAALSSTPQPQSWNEIWQGMFAQDDYQDDSLNWVSEWEKEESHINWRGLLIWGLVIYFLFFRRKNRGVRRHRR